jgi:muramoyltetrapeptide carboxypeptidase
MSGLNYLVWFSLRKFTMFRIACITFLVLTLIGVFHAVASAQTCKLTQPALLKPGDTIMFIAPAGELLRDRMMLAKKKLEERGYKVKYRDDLFDVDGYLAGSDERRAKELMQAFTDPEVDAVFPGTGGYGTTRILDMLDFDVIRQNPKLFIGFSDITALHAAFNKKAGLLTYHSPAVMYALGGDKPMMPFTERYLYRAIEHCPESSEDYTIETIGGDEENKVPQPFSLGKGKARGRLVGGNLSLLVALEGTPYSIDTTEAILLVEDVGEAPYRIDRMLQQLKSAGKLAKLRGVVVGQFTESEPTISKADQFVAFLEKCWREIQRLFIKVEEPYKRKHNPRFTAEGVLKQYFEPLGIPVLMNFPIGHAKMNCTLPLGGEVEIDADKATLTVMGIEL